MHPLVFMAALLLACSTFYSQTDSGKTLQGQSFVLTKKSKVNFESSDFSGFFNNVQGRIGLDDSMLVTGFDLVIDINSLEMSMDGMANHAKSADFFDATNYPSIVFFGDQISFSKEGWGVSGTMKSKGISIQRTIPFQLVQKGKDEVQIKTSFKILRTDFNIGEADAVSNDVQINAVLFAKKKT
ncbi:MAG: YceI family protein [Flavobacteriia bacterium]|nr:YceI family protein [Flavobacteriia bacterium]